MIFFPSALILVIIYNQFTFNRKSTETQFFKIILTRLSSLYI